MLTRLLWLLLVSASVGCGKQPAPAAPAGDASSAAADANSASDATGQAQIAAQLSELTQTVRKYSAEHQRAPKSLDELVTAGYLSSIPAAPAGKKFVINKDLRVILATR
jgi:hypothetical protein